MGSVVMIGIPQPLRPFEKSLLESPESMREPELRSGGICRQENGRLRKLGAFICLLLIADTHAERIGPSVRADLDNMTHLFRANVPARRFRIITLEGDLDAGQRAQLIDMANKCPVHRTLKSEIDIRTVEEPASGRK